MLGQGQYGAVYRGVYQGDTQVAVKTLKATASTKDFLLEAAIMKVLTFPCPSIVPLDTFPSCPLEVLSCCSCSLAISQSPCSFALAC
jgi:hypothetical protein